MYQLRYKNVSVTLHFYVAWNSPNLYIIYVTDTDEFWERVKYLIKVNKTNNPGKGCKGLRYILLYFQGMDKQEIFPPSGKRI